VNILVALTRVFRPCTTPRSRANSINRSCNSPITSGPIACPRQRVGIRHFLVPDACARAIDQVRAVLLAPVCRSSSSAHASRSAVEAPLPPVFAFVHAYGCSDGAFLAHRKHSRPAARNAVRDSVRNENGRSASDKGVPHRFREEDPELFESRYGSKTFADLPRWRSEMTYVENQTWIFASERMKGRQPLWPKTIGQNYVRPVAERANITKRIGWRSGTHS
jgi:hypothetical protein